MSASVAAMLFAAATTPGPNNLVVTDAASQGKLTSVAAPIAGIVIGTLGMVLSIRFGLDAALTQWPTATGMQRYIGAALLPSLAARSVIGGWKATAYLGNPSPARGSFFAMLLLQIGNPKTWVLAATVSAAHVTTGGSLAVLVLLTASVPATCLTVWAIAGRALAPFLARTMPRRAFALMMGGSARRLCRRTGHLGVNDGNRNGNTEADFRPASIGQVRLSVVHGTSRNVLRGCPPEPASQPYFGVNAVRKALMTECRGTIRELSMSSASRSHAEAHGAGIRFIPHKTDTVFAFLSRSRHLAISPGTF
ncbi:MAG: LysE family transporter [Pseudomonadota bacterium]